MLLGDELFSDSFPIKLIDNVYYEVEGKVSVCRSCELWCILLIVQKTF